MQVAAAQELFSGVLQSCRAQWRVRWRQEEERGVGKRERTEGAPGREAGRGGSRLGVSGRQEEERAVVLGKAKGEGVACVFRIIRQSV